MGLQSCKIEAKDLDRRNVRIKDHSKNGTYGSKFQKVFEIVFFISLESVEGYFRRQLAGWN